MLLVEIERFLRASGMSETLFGRKALRDPRFVSDLRKGREPRPRTVERARGYIASARP